MISLFITIFAKSNTGIYWIKKLKCISLLIILLFSNSIYADIIFNDGFENGLIQFSPSGNTPTIATIPEPVYLGTNSMRVELTPDSTTNYRTEVTLKTASKWLDGETYSIGFNFYLEDWNYDSLPESIFQTHNLMDWSIPLTCTSPESGAQPLFISTKGDIMSFITYPSIVAFTKPIERKKWHSVVLQLKVSSGNDGMIKIWYDKSPSQEPDYEKINSPNHKPYACPDQVNKYFGVYPKLGTYKWDWKRTVAEATRRLSYYDNIKVGDAYASPIDVYTSKEIDVLPPEINFLSPANGSTVNGSVLISTIASDDSGTANIKQSLYIDGVVVSTSTGATLNYTWSIKGKGKGRGTSSVITIIAVDASGKSRSKSITVYK